MFVMSPVYSHTAQVTTYIPLFKSLNVSLQTVEGSLNCPSAALTDFQAVLVSPINSKAKLCTSFSYIIAYTEHETLNNAPNVSIVVDAFMALAR